MSEWDNYCDEIGGVCKDMEAQAARIAELEAERDRLREALEHVVKLLDRPMLKVDMCLYMGSAIKVACEALKGIGK